MPWVSDEFGETIVRVLIADGWRIERQIGRRVLLVKDGYPDVTIQQHATIQYPRKRVAKIWKRSGMNEEKYKKLLPVAGSGPVPKDRAEEVQQEIADRLH